LTNFYFDDVIMRMHIITKKSDDVYRNSFKIIDDIIFLLKIIR